MRYATIFPKLCKQTKRMLLGTRENQQCAVTLGFPIKHTSIARSFTILPGGILYRKSCATGFLPELKTTRALLVLNHIWSNIGRLYLVLRANPRLPWRMLDPQRQWSTGLESPKAYRFHDVGKISRCWEKPSGDLLFALCLCRLAVSSDHFRDELLTGAA